MESYDSAVEDFQKALESADPSLAELDRITIQEELRQAEALALAARERPKDHYKVLGTLFPGYMQFLDLTIRTSSQGYRDIALDCISKKPTDKKA